MINLFRSKIRCFHCGKNYKRKVERGSVKFFCGGYHNGNGCKERIIIFEKDIVELINKRYGKILTDGKIREVLDYIIIEGKLLFEIHFKDENEPILFKENYIQF